MTNPFLPSTGGVVRAARVRALGFVGTDLYYLRLCYAQSLLREQKPAQAILQLNHALGIVGVSEDMLMDWPRPYGALRWILLFSDAGFLGNPVRHFQHYATRMSGPNAEVRMWRAWVCYYISVDALDLELFPPDEAQLEKEGVIIPSREEVARQVPDAAHFIG